MPGALQSKLLRVLEQREFYRVGGTEAIPLRARIIAATNNNLKELIRSGQFREDLFYRIAVFEIYLPPLRERRSDIPLLVEYFVRKFNQDMKRKCFGPTTETMQALLGCNWRGNVRELRNVVERAMILCDGGHITPACLPPEISGVASLVLKTNNLRDAMHAYEQTHIRKVLTECEWNKEEAARRL
ncbi:MAG: sigma-54-dependent Fis family transcriptional regulator, partial [candidate division Zixibacteria bacterium]|nr:sigma-54-dependent Fis family transcriptional regulator [candidate division Zixibacteria bacterium]